MCRRQDGRFLGASAISITGISEPGILEALSLAADMQLEHACIVSDCLEVINGLEEVNLGRFGSVLAEI